MIYICNLRREKPLAGQANHVRVDRRSPLGNPFRMANEGQRDAVCEAYAAHLPDLLRTDARAEGEMRRLLRLAMAGDLYLYCWCAPKRCHAEAIRAYLETWLKAFNGWFISTWPLCGMTFGGRVWKEGAFWIVEVKALDVMTQGRTKAEALAMIADAAEALVGKPGFKATVCPGEGDDFELSANDEGALAVLYFCRNMAKEEVER